MPTSVMIKHPAHCRHRKEREDESPRCGCPDNVRPHMSFVGCHCPWGLAGQSPSEGTEEGEVAGSPLQDDKARLSTATGGRDKPAGVTSGRGCPSLASALSSIT